MILEPTRPIPKESTQPYHTLPGDTDKFDEEEQFSRSCVERPTNFSHLPGWPAVRTSYAAGVAGGARVVPVLRPPKGASGSSGGQTKIMAAVVGMNGQLTVRQWQVMSDYYEHDFFIRARSWGLCVAVIGTGVTTFCLSSQTWVVIGDCKNVFSCLVFHTLLRALNSSTC
ncbi:unnamed protein product [Protopolystoma xenopodis]|uniref:Uncharacterized protein n=1 Tax=Protopolystoma xenopodis TaxID=117903 RepID=A0A448X9D2_9PLAT|nr:unnamed protein product [Protopolystoma xenopodis]